MQPPPTPSAAVPTLTALGSDSLLVGVGSPTLRVLGAGFTAASEVRWNGASRPTQFVTAGELVASLTTDDVALPGSAAVSVYTPPPGGGTSASRAVALAAPAPAAGAVSPARVLVGGADSVVTITGTGFFGATRAFVGDSARAVTLDSPTQLRVLLTPADRTTAGPIAIRVVTPPPGGGTSVVTLAVDNPAPAVDVAAVPRAVAGQSGMSLLLQGSGFVVGTRVLLAGVERATTVESGTRLRAALTADDVGAAGSLALTVVTPPPGGGQAAVSLAVDNPAPAQVALLTPTATAEQAGMAVRVRGAWFPRDVQAFVGADPRAVTRDSASGITVALQAADVANPGTLTLRIVAPPPGGGEARVALEVRNPAPAVTALSHAAGVFGGDVDTLLVYGTGFVTRSRVRIGAAPVAATRLAPGLLRAVLGPSHLADAGVFGVTVTNDGPGGGTSNGLAYTVQPIRPELTNVSSFSATAGLGGFTLDAYGTAFARSTVATWNGVALPTTYVHAGRLRVDVASGYVSAPQQVTLDLETPGVGRAVSGAIFRVLTAPRAPWVETRTVELPARDVAYDPATRRLYASVPEAAPRLANHVVALDPNTGAILDSVLVGGDPGSIAVTAGTLPYLFVALERTGQVRRVALGATLTADAPFSVGDDAVAAELATVVGSHTSVLASLTARTDPTRHLGIARFTNGVRRPDATPAWGALTSFAPAGDFGTVRTPLLFYAGDGLGGVRTLAVDEDGVRERGTMSTRIDPGARVTSEGRRVFATGGAVVDAEAGTADGALPVPAQRPGRSTVVARFVGRIVTMSAAGTLDVYDLHTRQRLGSIPVPNVAGEPASASARRFRLEVMGPIGVAFRDGARLHIVRSGLFDPF